MTKQEQIRRMVLGRRRWHSMPDEKHWTPPKAPTATCDCNSRYDGATPMQERKHVAPCVHAPKRKPVDLKFKLAYEPDCPKTWAILQWWPEARQWHWLTSCQYRETALMMLADYQKRYEEARDA